MDYLFMIGKRDENKFTVLCNVLNQNEKQYKIVECVDLDKNHAGYDLIIVDLISEKEITPNKHGAGQKIYLFLHDTEEINMDFVQEDDFVLVNHDTVGLGKVLRGCLGTVITYGFNQKSCVTVSSVQDDGENMVLQFCVQRSFLNKEKKEVEAGEYIVLVPMGANPLESVGTGVSALILGYPLPVPFSISVDR